MIGKTVTHYKILEKLGEGGMGVVYKAEDTKLDRTVALKFLTKQALGGEEDRARFIHEAKSAAALPHPNICTVHEIDEAEGETFIAMEYVEGRSLKDRIESGPLKLEEAVGLAIQIAEGLQEAHEKGIVHRDIKAANVMMTLKGQAKIMDFGLAKSAKGAALTQAGTTMGTIAYMSPEQTRGEATDGRTDIWSLGAVLYEMVTGQRPFRGDYEQAVVYSILNAEPEPVTALRTGVPLDLERIINTCLEKEQAVRYQTAADFIADLRRLQRSMAGVVTESREASRPAEPARRSRRWAYVIGTVVVVAIALVVFRPYFAPVNKQRDSGRKMLVVLPFENLGRPEDEYFADGITDAITARLAGIHGLGVISRQSAVQYKDTDKNMRQIGDELGVDYVLEGTVQRERPGDPTSRVRVIPQLVDVADDTHIWAGTYDEEMTEVFRVQSDIAERVATELDIRLFEPERAALAAKPTASLEAYELYLRGIDYLGRRTSRTTALQALKMFEEAVELDPAFAEGWAGLSRAHTSLVWVEEGDPDQLSKAKAAAEKAVRLGPDLPEPHIALGYFYYYGTMEYDKALEDFAAALKLRPGDAEASTAMGLILRRMGRWEEALRYFRDAIKVDPRNYILNFDGLGLTNLFLRRYSEAERYLDRGISLAPEIANAHMIKSWFYLCWHGDVEAADRVWQQAIDEVDPGEYETIYSSGNEDVIVRLLPETASRILDRVGSQERGGRMDTATGYFYLAKAELSLTRGESGLAASYFDSARVILEPIVEMQGDTLPPAAQLSACIALGQAYAGLGLKEEALREGQAALELLPLSKDALGGPLVLGVMAEINTRVGEYDAAIGQLETLLSIPSIMSVQLLKLDPIWDPLRDNPRFQRLLEKYAEVGS